MEGARDFLARYADGEVAQMHDVVCDLDAAGTEAALLVTDLATRNILARWPVAGTFPAHGRNSELRIGATGGSTGARLVLTEAGEIARARALLPGLAARRKRDRRRQAAFLGASTAVLAGIVAAYIYGVPLLAGQIVTLVPPAWEKRLGDTVAIQMQATLARGDGFAVCDADPTSLANVAINRFANAALGGTGTPFAADVTVVKTAVPNAFALPGGKAFYFSGLLDRTETPDEFAGVLAHEMGHVVHRDGMQQLISSASTGLIIGFVLGDLSGISVAGGLGTTLIDSRFSRAAEANADRFAAETAKRLRFQPVGLANLLERVAKDDTMTEALAFLSTHPLTEERRIALEALRPTDDPTLPPAFTDSEWQAIKHMCGTVATTSATPSPATGTGSNDPATPRSPPSGGPDDGERHRDKATPGA